MSEPRPRARRLDHWVELVRRDPDNLSEQLASLSLREQAELALALDAEDRLELLLHAPQPLRLIRSLPDADFYLTVREVGPTEALALIALGSATQLHHLIDLESWRRDRFDPDRSGAWIAVLLEAGEPALRRFLRTADDELLVLLAQRWLRVRRNEPEGDADKHGIGDSEAGHEGGLVSPDGYYLFSPSIPEHAPAIGRIAQLFYVEQRARYGQIMWSSTVELPAEVEERALQWRQSRLEEHGFPPWDEAIDVYAPPAGSHETDSALADDEDDPDRIRAARAPLRLAPTGLLIDALDGLDDEARERVLGGLLAVANRLLIADGAETGDPEAHRDAMRNATGYVTIALETRALDAAAARAALTGQPTIELFREGYARAIGVRERAQALTRTGWAAAHPRALELLEPPIRTRIEAALRPRPLYVTGDGEKTVWRAFRTPAEIEETRAAIEMAELVGRLLVGGLGLDVARVLEQTPDPGSDPPQFGTFMLTVLAWHAVRGERRGDALPDDVLADFLRDVASRRTAAADAPRRALEALIVAWTAEFALTARETALLRSFGRAGLERLSSECGGLDPGVPVDARYVSCLLLEPTPRVP
jgi:hypothetical protein